MIQLTRYIFLISLLVLCSTVGFAAKPPYIPPKYQAMIEGDSLPILQTEKAFLVLLPNDSVLVIPKRKPNLFDRLFDYISGNNQHTIDGRARFTFLGAPSYSNDKKFGLTAAAIASYNLNYADSTAQASQARLIGSLSTAGYRKLGIDGVHIFRGNKFRWDYDAETAYYPFNFWGIGFDNAKEDQNRIHLVTTSLSLKSALLMRITPRFYASMLTHIGHTAINIKKSDPLPQGLDSTLNYFGLGLGLQYDARDNIYNPQHGYLLSAEWIRYLPILQHSDVGNSFEIGANLFHRLWPTATMGYDLLWQANFGTVSWMRMPQPGDERILRGYYLGRYRDRNLLSVQAEIRQQIWQQLSVATWVGGASVYHNQASFKQWLHNVGIGLRWSLRPNIRIRIDYGWGRGSESGFVFQVNEAF